MKTTVISFGLLAIVTIAIGSYLLFSVKEDTKPSYNFAKIDSFQLEAFKDSQKLQIKLKEILPFGAPVSRADDILVGMAGAYRSDNLIGDADTKDYRMGSSSSKNYIFYYLPEQRSGKNGWEDTKSGWVIKVIHGNFIKENDNDIKRSMGGSGKGILDVLVLTTPLETSDKKLNEHIYLAKEVLQYKLDMQPVELFHKEEWENLVEQHQQFGCKDDFHRECLMRQAITLLNYQKTSINRQHLQQIAGIVIRYGDVETAKALLAVWPSSESIHEAENSKSRLQKLEPRRIEDVIVVFEKKHLQLLFLTGQYEKADTELLSMHEREKDGSDFGAINALVKRGDLDKAYEVAQLTLEWKREKSDPKSNSSAHMHCYTYTRPKTRPAAMGDLALAYIEKGKLDKGYKTAQFIKHYLENNAFGQSSYCYSNFAKASYMAAIKQLVEVRSKSGNNDRAKFLFEELGSVLQEKTDGVYRYNKSNFEFMAKIAAENEIETDLNEIAEFVNTNNRVEYLDIYRSTTHDPVPMVYALAGDHQKAIWHIQKADYSPPKKTDNKKGAYSSPLMNLIKNHTPEDEVRLTTHLAIAKKLGEVGDKEGSLLFLQEATAYLGKRNSKRDKAVDNLSDYITKANILLDLDEKNKSHKVFNDMLSKFNQTTHKDYRGGGITKSFYGQFAYLYAHHDNIYAVQEWADKLPSFYLGAYYARIAALLIKEERWEELDQYFVEMARVFSTDKTPLANWYPLTYALIDAGEFDRYIKLINMLTAENKEAERRHNNRATYISTGNKPITPDTKQQIWMINQLLSSKMAGKPVPKTIISSVWPRFISNCESFEYILSRYSGNRSLNAKETMAACYLGIVNQFDTYKEMSMRLSK